MKTLMIAFLLQSPVLPPRIALEDPSQFTEISKPLQKDYAKVWSRFLTGKEDKNVIRDTDKLLKKERDFVPALIIQAYLDLYAGRKDAAQTRFDKVRSLESTHRIALYYGAELAFSGGNFKKANDLYGRLLKMETSRPDLEIKFQRALLLETDKVLRDAVRMETSGEFDQAEALYREALQLAPSEPRLYAQLGSLLLKEKKWEEALKSFQREAELSGGTSIEAQGHIAEVLRSLGRTDEAKNVSENLRNTDRQAADLKRQVAELEDLGRWGHDIELFRAIKSVPAITREQLAVLIVRYFPQVTDLPSTPKIVTDAQGSSALSDVPPVVGLGITVTRPKHTVEPAGTLSRRELAIALARLGRLLGLNSAKAPAGTPSGEGLSNGGSAEVQLVLQYGLLTPDN